MLSISKSDSPDLSSLELFRMYAAVQHMRLRAYFCKSQIITGSKEREREVLEYTGNDVCIRHVQVLGALVEALLVLVGVPVPELWS